MINPPKTREEAENYYRRELMGLAPRNRYFNPARCAYAAWQPISLDRLQCTHKAGHGPDKLYCRQHAAMVERSES